MNTTTRGSLVVAAFLAVVAMFALPSTRALALELSLIETGAGPNTSVGLWIQGFGFSFVETDRLVTPSGDVLTNSQATLPGTPFKSFDSLSEALNYVQGAWEETSTPRFGTPPAPFDFTINPVSPDTINRAAPVLLSPQPGAVIKNNTAFNLSWDYTTKGGPAPTLSLITIAPQFTNGSALSSFITTTPNGGPSSGGGSGSTGTGDTFFGSSMTNVSGATDNRFLLTLNGAAAALPLNAQITVGSYTSLIDAIPIDAGSRTPLFAPVNFYYSRQIAPFNVTLSAVPEPSAFGLGIMMVIAGVSGSPRLRRHTK